jgi:hypothetical protein
METVGSFRTRVTRDGAVEVWVKGWRLESQFVCFVPAALAVAFLLSPFSMPTRALGAALLLACAGVVLRTSRIGFRFDAAGVQIVEAFRTRRVVWHRFDGFVGERNEHEGRCVLLTSDGERIASPGTVDPDEMDTFWASGDVSAVDQLNRLASRLRRSFDEGGAISESALAAGDPVDDVAEHGAESPGARRLRSMARG